MKLKTLISAFLCLFATTLFSQRHDIDSLTALSQSQNAKTRVNAVFGLSNIYTYSNYDSALKYSLLGLHLSETFGFIELKANFLNGLGTIYLEKGEYDKALVNYIEAEKQFKELGDKRSVIMVNGNIGIIYSNQNLFNKAKIQYESALETARENNYKDLIAANLNALGILYYSEGKKDEALINYKEALKMNLELKSKIGINDCLNNIAVIYQETGRYQDALNYYQQYMSYAKQDNQARSQIAAYHNIALVYKDMNNVVNSIIYLDSSIVLAQKIRAYSDLIEIYSTYTEIFTKANNYEKAFETFQLKSAAKDSLLKQSRDKQFIEMSTKYDSEKKEAENKILKAKGEKQKAINMAVSIGIILIAALAFFIFRSYRIKQKANTQLSLQNDEIRAQKRVIEDKQTEILDSISYAKRLQDAILPPLSLVKTYFQDTFILYKPKDIVAGDFYWLEHKNDYVFFAAADSTGHGVPGAMVSVVCSTSLSRAVKEFGILDPGKILDKTRELIIETFEKSEKDVKDGMDISLISIHKKTGEIKWAGAFNRLWYTAQNNIIELSPDKQPIGKIEELTPFTTHTILPKKGDCFYLFTDGFPDQFGGPQGKKLKYKLFKETIAKNAALPMDIQKQKLESLFDNWKGNHEQIDDVCVIGIKI